MNGGSRTTEAPHVSEQSPVSTSATRHSSSGLSADLVCQRWPSATAAGGEPNFARVVALQRLVGNRATNRVLEVEAVAGDTRGEDVANDMFHFPVQRRARSADYGNDDNFDVVAGKAGRLAGADRVDSTLPVVQRNGNWAGAWEWTKWGFGKGVSGVKWTAGMMSTVGTFGIHVFKSLIFNWDHLLKEGMQIVIPARPDTRRVPIVKSAPDNHGKLVYTVFGYIDYKDTSEAVSVDDMKYVELKPHEQYVLEVSPHVSLVNGMMVSPRWGLSAGLMLQKEIGQNMSEGRTTVLPLRVLATYSAQKGLLVDVFECVLGKVWLDVFSVVTKQRDIMVDAVRRKQLRLIIAHSRGTIKTDLAVSRARDELVRLCLADKDWTKNKEVIAMTEAMYENPDHSLPSLCMFMGDDLIKKELTKVAIRNVVRRHVEKMMDKYLRLIYAGNVVIFPTDVLSVGLLTSRYDLFTFLFGSYSSTRTKYLTRHRTIDVGTGYHDFMKEYGERASKLAADELLGLGRSGWKGHMGYHDEFETTSDWPPQHGRRRLGKPRGKGKWRY